MKAQFKTSEVASLFNVTSMAVIDWIKAGKLTAYETGGGHYRIMRDDLIGFVKKQNRPMPEELDSDKYRILIVDDEKNIIESLKAILDDLGVNLEIETATNGFEAGMKVIHFFPHLVILDALMPGADGEVVVKLIKDTEVLKKTKILVFTGYPEEGKKMLKQGADKVIEKSSQESSPELFRKEVCKLLGVKFTKVIV